MARRRRAFLPSTPWLALRGLIAVAVAGAVAAVLVARASGNLEPAADVYVGIPVSAGLITTQSPVRYHGVNVGRIAEIESGTMTSRVRLTIDKTALPLIPAAVVARIVPRTFFGDIYLQLVDNAPERSPSALTQGATILMDDSADAMALYDVFKKIVDVFSQIRPERMQMALTALSQALRNRGAEIGSTIDDLSDAARVLTPSVARFLDATPQFRDVMEALHTAAPDIITTLSAATSVSDRLVDDQQGFTKSLDAIAGLGSVLAPFLSDHREQLITVVDSAGTILATTAGQSQGLVDTLAGARAFGEAGGRVFATDKFNITAVATFAGPMPYAVADCPVYGNSRGAQCRDSEPVNPVPMVPVEVPAPRAESPDQPTDAAHYPAEAAPASAIVGGRTEAHALALLQDQVLGHGNAERPNIATVLMLGPLVRGTEVRVE